ncbi:kit ligand a isoform X1 [Oryzias melastigma]|uniref:kit ligand a isoform X1 n=1 Tax=Oryzias melastigma TaxID=30732 RepID=UPI000CF82185|nr:kit ligand a isoform X1 [Oryzias melastigma]
MKKSKSWIHVCVRFLLFITLGVLSDTVDSNPITDDIVKLSVLKQNIPRDYNISVLYIPKELAEMCWVKINIFYLEDSLDKLARKFGNISSNKKDIEIFIDMLQDLRLKLMPVEPIMQDFACHYREGQWKTEEYFEYVEDLLTSTKDNILDDCDPPPCPTPPPTGDTRPDCCNYSNIMRTGKNIDLTLPPATLTTNISVKVLSPETTSSTNTCLGCSTRTARTGGYTGVPEKLLQSLPILFIPLLALVFLLVWKLQSKRNEEISQPSETVLFTEGTSPPTVDEASETLQVTETV